MSFSKFVLDDLFAASSGRWLWGNTFTRQICDQFVCGRDAIDFVKSFLGSAGTELPLWYGHGHFIDEWDQKNISREGGGMMGMEQIFRATCRVYTG